MNLDSEMIDSKDAQFASEYEEDIGFNFNSPMQACASLPLPLSTYFVPPAPSSEEVLKDMREKEAKYLVYNPKARYIKYRRELVDYLVNLGSQFRMSATTVHAAVRLMDHILSSTDGVPKDQWQLVAMCTELVSAKFLELGDFVPSLNDLRASAEYRYSVSMIRDMELRILDALGWSLTVVTPLHFLEFFLADPERAVFTGVDHHDPSALGYPLAYETRALEIEEYMKKYVEFFVYFCLQEHCFSKFRPSIVAAAIICCSRVTYRLDYWSDELTRLTGCCFEDIYPCVHTLLKIYHRNFPASPSAPSSTTPSSPASHPVNFPISSASLLLIGGDIGSPAKASDNPPAPAVGGEQFFPFADSNECLFPLPSPI